MSSPSREDSYSANSSVYSAYAAASLPGTSALTARVIALQIGASMNVDLDAGGLWLNQVVGKERVHLKASREWDYVPAAFAIWQRSPATRVFRAVASGYMELRPVLTLAELEALAPDNTNDDLDLAGIARRRTSAGMLPPGVEPELARCWLRRELLFTGQAPVVSPQQVAVMEDWIKRRGDEPEAIARVTQFPLEDVLWLLTQPSSAWCYLRMEEHKAELIVLRDQVAKWTASSRLDLLADSLFSR